MGEYDNRLRRPLLRRLIVLVVVVAAAPVIMWSITAFVRGYVAQPKTPTFRPLAPMALVETPGSALAGADTATKLAEAGHRIVEARATASDASPSPIVPIKTSAADASLDGDGPSPATGSKVAAATPTPPTTGSIPSAAPANSAAPAAAGGAVWPGPPGVGPGNETPPPPASDDATADSLPPAPPITGRIPLPPHRPRLFAMVQAPGGVPVPRARPTAAPETAPVEPEAPSVDRMLVH